MHQPERTCVGCRTKRLQVGLLRMRRRSDGRIAPAARAKKGRSVYLCRDRRCYDRAVRRQALSKGLRGRCSYDVETLWSELITSEKGGE